MYGVPANLDLSFLNGSQLIQVCLGQYQVQFNFHPTASIAVQGGWELLNAAGEQIDCHHEEVVRPPYQLHRILGQRVVGAELSAPQWFALRFEGGELLRVFDDSTHYETFSIEPGGIFV